MLLGKLRTSERRMLLTPYLFILPALIVLGIFWAYPISDVLYLSFTSYNFFQGAKLIGLTNYAKLFHDTLFLHSLEVSLEYAFVSQLITMGLALLLALFINTRLKGMGVYSTILFLPFVVSSVAISLIWGKIFDYTYGPLNAILRAIGVRPQYWLGSSSTALISLMIIAIWQFVGYQAFLFLSGLQSIPSEFYQAAALDGAGVFRQFRKITLPLLKPTILFVLVLATMGGLQVFTPVYVLTQGGPLLSTYSSVYDIYVTAFHYLQFGYASAMSVLFFLITSIIIAVEFIMMRKGGSSYYATRN